MLLAAVSASAGGGPPAASARELAAQRYADVIHRMRYKVQDREHPATAAEIEAVAPVALALGEDLADPTVTWSEKRVALQALQHLHHAGRPAIPALVEALDLYPENNGPQGVGHFCEVTRTLAEVDPRDERGIRAVSGWLQQVRGGSICHRCGCALQLLEAAGPEARPIAGPVLEQFARGRVIMSDDFQLGKTLKAVGVSGAMAATLMERVIDSGVSPEDRAGTLKALAQDAGQLLEADRAELARISALLLAHHRYRPLAGTGRWMDEEKLKVCPRVLPPPTTSRSIASASPSSGGRSAGWASSRTCSSRSSAGVPQTGARKNDGPS